MLTHSRSNGRSSPQHGLEAGDDVLGLLFFLRVSIPAELEVDAPDVVALLVQQHALVAVKRRVEPEPALGGVVGFHDHVGDQEAVHEDAALDLQAQQVADRAARAVGHDQPVGLDVKSAVGGVHAQADMVRLIAHTHHLVAPADVGAQFQGAGHHHFFQVVLLQVDHAGALVAGVGHQVEAIHLLLAEEGAPHVPAHALVAQRVAHAQAVEHFERAFGVADGA
jgi:hypothetical protein